MVDETGNFGRALLARHILLNTVSPSAVNPKSTLLGKLSFYGRCHTWQTIKAIRAVAVGTLRIIIPLVLSASRNPCPPLQDSRFTSLGTTSVSLQFISIADLHNAPENRPDCGHRHLRENNWRGGGRRCFSCS